MKRLLLAALILAVVFSGCKTGGKPAGSESPASLAGGSAEALTPPALHEGPSQEEASSEAEIVTREESIPEHSVPLSAAAPVPQAPASSAPPPAPSQEAPAAEAPPPAGEPGDSGTVLNPELISGGDNTPGYSPTAVAGKGDIDAAEFEEELFRLINAEREARGVGALGMEDRLRFAAKIRADEVLESLSHTRPDGSAYYTAFDEADFDYAGKWHGENASQIQFPRGTYTSREAAAYMFEQLRASSGHLNNMISGHYAQIGIGASMQTDGDTVRIGSAQLFAGV